MTEKKPMWVWIRKGDNTPDYGRVKMSHTVDSVNPTGGVFTGYTPEQRATAKLGENITTLSETMGKNPDDTITIYRGAPKNQKDIVPGDFVTTNRQLAKDYAGDGVVLEKRVRIGDILDDKTEPLGEEYIYKPTTVKYHPVTNRELEKIHEAGQVAYFAHLPDGEYKDPDKWRYNPYPERSSQSDEDGYLKWRSWLNGWTLASFQHNAGQKTSTIKTIKRSTSRKARNKSVGETRTMGGLR